MIKKLILASSIAITSLAMTGCNNSQIKVSSLEQENNFFKIVDIQEEQNLIIVQYEKEKIAMGYFQPFIEKYCNKYNLVASPNEIKTINKKIEQVSYSCIKDDK